jgi:hypothetical protein
VPAGKPRDRSRGWMSQNAFLGNGADLHASERCASTLKCISAGGAPGGTRTPSLLIRSRFRPCGVLGTVSRPERGSVSGGENHRPGLMCSSSSALRSSRSTHPAGPGGRGTPGRAPHSARAGDPPALGGRASQRGHRPTPAPQRPHRADPRPERPGEAGGALEAGGRYPWPPARAWSRSATAALRENP